MKTEYRGIDYSGIGVTCNRDKETGIRYGIIPQNQVGQAWFDSSEPDYGSPHCPYCGHDLKEGKDYVRCPKCRKAIRDMGECYPDECNGCSLDDGEYKAFSDDSGDVWVIKSPYYTRAQFCSPCAPGACYLANPCDDGEKAYCFGHDWFDDGKAPYPVYSVETDELVNPETR